MPQIGHAPGPSDTTSGSIGQIHFEEEEREREEEEEEDFSEGEEDIGTAAASGSAGVAGMVRDGSIIPAAVPIGSNGAPLFPLEEYLSGSLRNFSAQLFAQKCQSRSPQRTVAAARSGSTFMPQTGSTNVFELIGQDLTTFGVSYIPFSERPRDARPSLLLRAE